MVEYITNEDYPQYMYHVARRQPTESVCEACTDPLPGELKWSETNKCFMFGAMMVGPFVAVITDRSGSEQATVHNDTDCILAMMESLQEDSEYDSLDT